MQLPLVLLLGLVGLLGPGASMPQGTEDPRPNILLIVSDDHAASVLGGEGHPVVETPHLDRLAKEGVLFEDSFTTTSLCSPGRASLLTGRYARAHGVITNADALPKRIPNLASLLGAAGYATGYVGKHHLGGSAPHPDFAWRASFVGQGRYRDCAFVVNGGRRQTKGFVDEVSVGFASEFLRLERDAPFFLVVGLKAPHAPFEPKEHLRDAYAEAAMAWPENAASHAPFPSKDEFRTRPFERRRSYSAGVPATWDPAPTRGPQPEGDFLGEELRNYFRMVAGLDEDVGALLDVLEEQDLLENTVVVYTSDNGMHLGEHGLLLAKRSAYEESIRIPLLVRLPAGRAAGTRIAPPVLNVDLAPTLLELAGVDAEPSMQGRSWLPLLGGSTEWRDGFLYENYVDPAFPNTPELVAWRTPEAKLVLYTGFPEWTELFDLTTDPLERRNLARDPAHADLLAALGARLARAEEELGERPPSPFVER